ncbi:hypothetical protein PT974_04504 [Cladobotryum mycophilum]|uniref:C2H2-type domain-containing protein n=1 Tax=Cladobotryum mycophilum TaxID=491253 RepID=A0ABR0SW01_9HYPO
MLFCEPCNRSFSNGDDLRRHLKSASQSDHPTCHRCQFRFNCKDAMREHFEVSPNHNRCHRCSGVVDFVKASELEAHVAEVHENKVLVKVHAKVQQQKQQLQLQKKKLLLPAPAEKVVRIVSKPDVKLIDKVQHVEKVAAHNHNHNNKNKKDSPLDDFFMSFKGYRYNPSFPPSTSWKLLGLQLGWKKGEDGRGDVWERYQDALRHEVRVHFGEEDDPDAWFEVARAVDLEKYYGCAWKYEIALKKKYVNIIDLIHYAREKSARPVKVKCFDTQRELEDYTRKTNKVFELKRVRVGESNIVLNHLFRDLNLKKPAIKRLDRQVWGL